MKRKRMVRKRWKKNKISIPITNLTHIHFFSTHNTNKHTPHSPLSEVSWGVTPEASSTGRVAPISVFSSVSSVSSAEGVSPA